jgi:hypothetical protein
MRAIAVAGLLVVCVFAARAASAVPGQTVPCAETIAQTHFPFLGSNRPQYQYRTRLNAVSVPEAYHQQIVPTGERPWAYWRKSGLVVRAGRTVTIAVPRAWRSRAAIIWGNGGQGPFSSIRLEACPGKPDSGFAFPGGFYLRSPSACLPLIFTVGNRSAAVRFGLGRRCP